MCVSRSICKEVRGQPQVSVLSFHLSETVSLVHCYIWQANWLVSLENSPVSTVHLIVGVVGLQTCLTFCWSWGSELRSSYLQIKESHLPSPSYKTARLQSQVFALMT